MPLDPREKIELDRKKRDASSTLDFLLLITFCSTIVCAIVCDVQGLQGMGPLALLFGVGFACAFGLKLVVISNDLIECKDE